MSKVNRIILKGFKSVRELDIELTSLNVLIGANGSGKSNFIAFFNLLNQIVQKNLQYYVGKSGGVDSFLHFGQKVTDSIFIEIFFGDNGYVVELAPTSNNSLIFKTESCWYWDRTKYERPFSSQTRTGHQETYLPEARKDISNRVEYYVLSSLENWKVYHFHDTSDSAKIKATGNIYDNERLNPDGGNLAAFLYLLQERQSDYYENIVRTIRVVAPFFADFILRPNPLNPETIILQWREEGSAEVFNASHLSDGTLRLIALTTLLLQPRLPTTILIDEPELGLHPQAIRLLAGMIKSAAEKTQVIISTQSVTLINQFSLEDIIVVDKKNKESTFKRLHEDSLAYWLEEYQLGDIWEKNIIGGNPQR